MADLMSAASAAQKVLQLVKLIDESRIDKVVKEALTEQTKLLNQDIINTQSTLLQSIQDRDELRNKNQMLNSQLADLEDFNEAFSNYVLSEAHEGVLAYKYLHEPAHFICPSCARKKQISILQHNRGKLFCPERECDFEVFTRSGTVSFQD